MKSKYFVVAEYPSFWGADKKYDEKIERIARRESVSSGFSYMDCYRDIKFNFVSRKSAYKTAARIRAKCRKRGMHARVWRYDEDN